MLKPEELRWDTSFLSTCEGKNTEQLWQEFKGEIDQIISTHQNSQRQEKPTLDHSRVKKKNESTGSPVSGTKKVWER